MREPRCILITGGCGFIGSAFIRFLFREPGFTGRIVNLDLLTYAGNPLNLEGHVDERRYTFVHGDIANRELVTHLCRTHGVDTIVNFAAESHVDRSIDTPEAFVRTNIVGTFELLQVVRGRPDIHLHHVSTDEVFGSLGPEGRFSEESPYQPSSPYSAAKAAADHLVHAWAHTYGISVTLSNCGNNYGPYQFPEKLLPLLIRNCVAGKPLPIYGDGKNVRDWIHVDDHVEALWAIVCRGAKGRTYNIGASGEQSNIDLVHLLCATMARHTGTAAESYLSLVRYVRDRPGHDHRYAIDSSRLEKELGWKPRRTLAAGLEETVRWYLGNPQWIEAIETAEYRTWLTRHYGAAS